MKFKIKQSNDILNYTSVCTILLYTNGEESEEDTYNCSFAIPKNEEFNKMCGIGDKNEHYF